MNFVQINCKRAIQLNTLLYICKIDTKTMINDK